MGWDVTEPRPPPGQLVIPRVNVSVQSHGGDDAGWGKLLTRPLELSGNPTSRVIWERVGGMGEGVRILFISIWDTSTDFQHVVKSYDMGPPALFPIREEGVLRIFIALENSSPQPGLNPWPLGPVASTLTTTPLRSSTECKTCSLWDECVILYVDSEQAFCTKETHISNATFKSGFVFFPYFITTVWLMMLFPYIRVCPFALTTFNMWTDFH
jgi:hypothetical protein